MYGKAPTDEVKRFCKRQLFQSAWELLQDEEFKEAYRHGFKEECGDGITRRFFPRFCTYSADYPEK